MMTADTATSRLAISRWHRNLLLIAAVITYLLVAMGGVVCVTGAGSGCPDWPGCYGGIVPPLHMTAVIEYLHRFVAAIAFPLIVAAAVVSWRKSRTMRWLSWPPAMAVVLVLVVSAFGAVAVLRGLTPGQAAVDLGLALIVLALLVASTVVAFAYRADPSLPDRLSGRGAFARLTFGALGAVYLVLVSSVLVAGEGSLTRCLGWPMWRWIAVDAPGWPQPARQLLAGLAGLLIVAVVLMAWRTQRRRTAIVSAATAIGILFLVEMVVGVLMMFGNATAFLLVTYVATAAALWAMLVALSVLAGLAPAAEPELAPIGAQS